MPHALTAPRRRPHRWPHRTLKQTLQDLDDGWAIKNKEKRKAFMQLKGLRYNKWSRSVSSDHVPRAVPCLAPLLVLCRHHTHRTTKLLLPPPPKALAAAHRQEVPNIVPPSCSANHRIAGRNTLRSIPTSFRATIFFR